MAATVTERYAQQRVSQTTTTTLSPTGNIVVGSYAVLCAQGSNKKISSVSDDAGNTWAVHVAFTGNSRSVSFASCPVTTQIGTGSVITITWVETGSLAVGVWVQEVTGLSASAFDQSATGTAASGTAVATDATPTLAQADEVCFAGFRTQPSTAWTKGATWTDVTTPLLSVNQALEYKIVSATTGVVGDGTFDDSGSWAGAVVTFKIAADTPVPGTSSGGASYSYYYRG